MDSGTLLGSSSHSALSNSSQYAGTLVNSAFRRSARAVLPDGTASSVEDRTSVQTPTVYLVDNDPRVLESLTPMIRNIGLNVESYTSAEAFLDGFRDCPHSPKCIVAAIRLPGLSGLGLLRMLEAEGKHIPVIMISGCGDIPMVVEAMRSGAINFLEKPINNTALSAGIREALDCNIRQQRGADHKAVLTKQINKLSARQREVFNRLVAGEHTKQIANTLGIGEKTVAKHRAFVLEKMQVDSVVELVCLFADAPPTFGNESASVTQYN